MTRKKRNVVLVALLVLTLGGCASAPDRSLSLEDSRFASLVTGKDPLHPKRYKLDAGDIDSGDADLFRFYEKQRGHALNVLLLSGGGQNGAFGAGVLKGWRKAGTRPEFDIVTGVSTGALLATHAFLGTPADDVVLEKLFTGLSTNGVYTKRSIFSVLSGAISLLNTDPLKALIEKHITAEVIARVAAEHAKGRRLLVGTTNLDYAQTWAWNLGAIATEGGPEALELYRKVLRASSAFPIMFPPVEIEGHLFADGAVRANLLIVGLSGATAPGPPLFGSGTVYVVVNGVAVQFPKAVKASVIEIAGTTIGEMMGSSTEALLTRSYFSAQVHGYDFRLISVPQGVDIGNNPLAFDPEQMRAGFNAGYAVGQQPEAWSNEPPLIGDFPGWALDVIKKKP